MKLDIKFHKAQSDVWRSPARFRAAIAGVQGGKTFLGVVWMGSIAKGGGNYLIAAPTYKILNQSTLPKFFETFPIYRKFWKKQDGTIDLPDGTTIYIRSTETPEGLEGMTLDGAWLDEAGQMKYMAWVVIQARLAIRQGKCLITTTPYSMNWLKHDFFRYWEEGHKDYDVIQWASIDSPYFPREEYLRMKDTLSEELFEMRYRGQFRNFAGLVYREFDRSKHVKVIPRGSNWKLYRGIDWGFKDPLACLWFGVRNDNGVGRVHIYREHYHAEKSTDWHINEIKKLSGNEKYSWGVGDSALPQMLKDFMMKGIELQPAIKGPGSIQAGIERVRNHLRDHEGSPLLTVDPSCVNTIDEFETYRYKEPKEDKNQDDNPVDFANHSLDVCRYFIHKYSVPRESYVSESGPAKLPPPPSKRRKRGKFRLDKFRNMYRI